jgi:hypothetical protein
VTIAAATTLFTRTVKRSPEQDSYVSYVPFSFLILIGRFVTLVP